jgi:hypothetical protein
LECFIPLLSETPTVSSHIKGHFFREDFPDSLSKLASLYYSLWQQTVLVIIIPEIFFVYHLPSEL